MVPKSRIIYSCVLGDGETRDLFIELINLPSNLKIGRKAVIHCVTIQGQKEEAF